LLFPSANYLEKEISKKLKKKDTQHSRYDHKDLGNSNPAA
jgi:hypothetical protein